MNDDKQVIGRLFKNRKPPTLPYLNYMVMGGNNATILYLSNMKIKGKYYRSFIGVGTVIQIKHGSAVDIVTVKLGGRCLQMVATMNHARRMVMSLVKGHLCTVYGFARWHTCQFRKKDGTTYKKLAKHHYAWGFQDWFLPRMADFGKVGDGNIDKLSEKEEKIVQDTLDNITLEDIDGYGT